MVKVAEKENSLQEENNEDFKGKRSLTEAMRQNPWVVSTFILGIIVIVLLFSNFSGGITGNVISSSSAGDKLLKFYEASGAEGLTVKNVEEASGLYKINFDYKGSVVPIYMTKDGKLAGSLNPLSTTDSSADTTPQDIPKTDKPVVELYVFTYCPYGLQMEKVFDPVVKLLGSKIDFKIRQIGAMHGEYEKVEAKRQLCIEKNYPDKFLAYVNAFALDTAIGACSSDTSCSLPKVNALMTKLGIDGTKIDACMKTDGETLYAAEEKNAGAKSVSGSPTVIINGVDAQLSRTPDAVKTAICAAFTDGKVPSECSQILSTTAAAAGFGGEGVANPSTTHASGSC